MIVRRLRASEWEAWKRLRLSALSDAPDAFGSTFDRESAYSDGDWRERTRLLAGADDRAMFVAEDEAGPIGCGGAFVGEDGTPAIVSMWVEPRSRGRGVGRRLVAAIETWARQHGSRRLVLHVVEGNPAAEAVYLRAGFRRTGRTFPMPRDAGLVMVEMERALP